MATVEPSVRSVGRRLLVDAADGHAWWRGPFGLALLVCAAYTAGTLIGLRLRLPPATPSVIWPPNAILTTALLFTPVSRWWIVFVAALPAHLALQLGTFSSPLALAFFLTNSSEALLGATAVRLFNDQPTRFDSLQRVTVFICGAALFGPLVSSFLDAGAVHLLRGDDYWDVWKARSLANVLTTMAVVPAAAALLNLERRPVWWPEKRGRDLAIAAALLVFSLLGAAGPPGLIDLSRMRLAAFLPFLLWSAVRFGVAGAGVAIFTSVLIVVFASVAGQSPFDYMPMADRIPVIQTFLIVAATPLLCVAGLVEERHQSEAALRDADATKSAILASLPSHVAVLDRRGRIIAINDNWNQATREDSLPPTGAISVGQSYLEDPSVMANPGMAGSIQAVLDGQSIHATWEYSHSSDTGRRWFAISIVPLKRAEGGAVITHTEITEQRRAEIEAQQSREELAHVARVWVLGELTASLSHQLHQPLTAIAGNAQAGRQFLKVDVPDLIELGHIFDDIVADAARAADVIHGVRDLLRKGSGERGPQDVNRLVNETVRLVSSESIIRGALIRTELDQPLAPVVANRVQLQQVVLNLVINALEAVGSRQGERLVTVKTARDDADNIRVMVMDTGTGLPPGDESLVFEPFHTTKPSGMGMGLAIARAIIEAHGGLLWAQNRPEGGALFAFKLPTADTTHPPVH